MREQCRTHVLGAPWEGLSPSAITALQAEFPVSRVSFVSRVTLPIRRLGRSVISE